MSRCWRIVALLTAFAAAAGAQIIGGGESGNATSIQGKPVAATAPASGNCLVFTTSWGPGSCSGTASTNWSSLVSGTNTTGAFLIGTGASLGTTGSGIIAATSVPALGLGAGTISNNTSGNAGTANALAGTPSQCTGSQFATGIAANGNANCGTPGGATKSIEMGIGDGVNAIAAATYPAVVWKNATGSTLTITGIQCYTNNGGSSTLDVKNGSGTSFLTGPVTCSSSWAAGTQSGTTTLANGDTFNFSFTSDGSSKTTTWLITFTY